LVRLAGEELTQRFGCSYGTVNPFAHTTQFIHVFDTSVTATFTSPHTMMTNAGDHTWGVEFRPTQVVEALQRETEVYLGNIATRRRVSAELPSFGIITGNGPESGIALWRQINDSVYAKLPREARLVGDLAYPRVLVHSLPEMGLSMELDSRQEEVWSVIRNAVEQLCAANVGYIALACNTTQFFGDRIRELTRPRGVEFVSMAEVVMDHIRAEAWKDLTIIGIPLVAELGEYSAYRALGGLGVHPVGERAHAALQELGYLVKRLDRGGKDSRALNLLRNVLRDGVSTSRVLVALTEISILLQRFPKLVSEIAGKTVVDALRLYGEALAKIYLDALPQIEDDEDEPPRLTLPSATGIQEET
jgi:aspartate/glutamate racemase